MDSSSTGPIVNFYIDGLNVYWRIKECLKVTGQNYQWLDYYALCQSFLRSNEKLGKVYLFTSPLKETVPAIKERYDNLKKAQEESGVIVIEGYINKYNQEKGTDLKLGIQILLDALFDECNKILLMSTDNDFAVVYTEIANLVSCKKIQPKSLGIITPPTIGIPKGINELRKSCSSYINRGSGKEKKLVKRLKFDDLNGFSLPEKKLDESGNIIFEMPNSYQMF